MSLRSRIKAVVLAGGKGERLQPLTTHTPKPLIRIVGKALVDYVLEGLTTLPLEEVIVIVSDRKVGNYIVGKWSSKLLLTVAYQRKPGIEGAMLAAREYLGKGESFVLAYGDIVVDKEAYLRTYETYLSKGSDGVIMLSPKIDVESYGIAYVSEERISKVEEKPIPQRAKSTLAVAGIFILPYAIFEYLETDMSFTESLNTLASTRTLTYYMWSKWWVDIGYPWDILEANKNILSELKGSYISDKAHVSSKAIVEGKVYIDDEAEVDHNAIIKGPVYIGKNSFVGAGAFVRKFASIEEEVIVGAYSEVKNSSIQPNVTISSFSFIGDSIVGSNTTIGPRTITLNIIPSGVKVSRLHPLKVKDKVVSKLGAIIGCNCYIGASSVLYAGSVVESNTRLKPFSTVETNLSKYA